MNALPTLLTRFRDTLAQLHRDERGAEGLEKLLIIAAIVLPLLGLLIVFRQRIGEWVDGQWTEVKGEGDSAIPGDTP
jgi:Flp pilus assembly pilin Flp